MRLFLLALCLVLALALPAAGQTYTYQGRLLVNNQPANGSFEFVGSIFGVSVGGAPIGTASGSVVNVVNGLFTITLPANPATFSGGDRWLELRVRQGTTGPLTLLSPRQRITPAPYAVRALNEWLLPIGGDTLRADPTRSRFFLNRDAPITQNEYFGITTPTGPQNLAGMFINTAAEDGVPFYGYATGGAVRAFTAFNPTGTDWRVNISGSDRFVVSAQGRVGVNKTSPQTALDVNGDATAGNYHYSTPRTRTVSFGPSAFIPRNPANAVISDASHRTYYTAAEGQGNFKVALTLPHGAVITNLTAYLVDNSATADISVSLRSKPFADFGSAIVAQGSTTGASSLVQTISIPVGSVVVDNTARVYHINVFSSEWAGSNTAIMAATITYTVSGPD
jgi:hypothetical protein